LEESMWISERKYGAFHQALSRDQQRSAAYDYVLRTGMQRNIRMRNRWSFTKRPNSF
jgi:hypothetical protein